MILIRFSIYILFT